MEDFSSLGHLIRGAKYIKDIFAGKKDNSKAILKALNGMKVVSDGESLGNIVKDELLKHYVESFLESLKNTQSTETKPQSSENLVLTAEEFGKLILQKDNVGINPFTQKGPGEVGEASRCLKRNANPLVVNKSVALELAEKIRMANEALAESAKLAAKKEEISKNPFFNWYLDELKGKLKMLVSSSKFVVFINPNEEYKIHILNKENMKSIPFVKGKYVVTFEGDVCLV